MVAKRNENMSSFQRAMTKNVDFFEEKNRIAPSVAAPGDAKLSAATVSINFKSN